jgi:uncharacterized protein
MRPGSLLIHYLDTSLLVAALTNEAKTRVIQDWLGDQEPDALAISVAEFSAALSIKLRSHQIEADSRAEALAAFTRVCIEHLVVLPVSGVHFRSAARFADRHDLGLRAGDALHLAICADHGATLNTLDRHLSDAGPALGIKTELI